MTKSHSEVIYDAIEAWGPTLQRSIAPAIERAINKAGYLIVGKDAIRNAQREAVAQEREDTNAR